MKKLSILLFMVGENINIFQFSDFRPFLKEYYRKKKSSKGSKWGLSVWARQLGIKSPSTLTMILNGQRNPSSELAARLCRTLELTSKESNYFRDLIALQRHQKDTRISVLIMERLGAEHPSGKFVLLDSASFFLISNWYNYAIREMVKLEGFREQPSWIASKLAFQISVKDVKLSLSTLVRLGLLERDDFGALRPATAHVGTSNDIEDEGLKRFHEQMLRNAASSVRKIESNNREISGSTISFSTSNLVLAKQLIRKFREEFIKLAENDSDADSVYHLEVAFFPLTKPNKGERDV